MKLPHEQKKIAVCTCVEGDYHYGLAALTNSLHQGGFAGAIYVLLKGPLPVWCPGPLRNNSASMDLGSITIHFEVSDNPTFLASLKAEFMLAVIERDPSLNAVVYFDPDIVLAAPWTFVERWINSGVALCEDNVFGSMASDHFIRHAWVRFAKSVLGSTCLNSLNRSFNSGFVGVGREHISFLTDWANATRHLFKMGIDVAAFKPGTRRDPFFGTDQDTLNVATMINASPLATLGPEGMGFVSGMEVMWHAVDSPKPWRRNYLISLIRHGARVPPAHRNYWEHANGLINPWSPLEMLWHRLDLKLAVALSRFYHSA